MSDNNTRLVIVHPGSRVIDATGEPVTIVAVRPDGVPLGIGPFDRAPRLVRVRTDAFGGEHDQAIGLPVAA